MARRFAAIIGRRAVLLHRIETRGGDVYERGEVMRIRGAWRSGVHLEPLSPDDDARPGVRHVPRTSVRIVDSESEPSR